MHSECKNCGEIVTKNYCSNCGNNNSIKRIDKNYAIHEFVNLLGFEKGIFFTTKELLLRPGKIIKVYLNENRQIITKPITYLLITSVIYTFISHYLKTDILYSEVFKKAYNDSTLTKINIWIQENYGYANLLLIFPIIIWLKIFFRKFKYNFYELFVLVSFIMGFGMILFSFQLILDYFSPKNIGINTLIVNLILLIYTAYALADFFGFTFKNFIKTFSSYVLGFLTFQLIITIIAMVYDVVTT